MVYKAYLLGYSKFTADLRQLTMNSETPQLLFLNSSEIKTLLPMADCIDLMTTALADLSRGQFHLPLRMIVRPPEARGLMAMMPAYRNGERRSYGLKALCFFHDNPALNKDAHQGCVLLSSGDTGELLAIMNATAITAIRTAAVSAVATKLLARPNASTLAIIGTGVQARQHLVALSHVRRINMARVFSPNPDHPKQLAEEMRGTLPFPVEPVTSAEDALKDADLIVTATSSREPVLQRQWISDGAHINAIGTYSPQSREIDSQTMAAAQIFVDRRESAVNEAGDFLLAVQEGAIGSDSIVAEVGEVLLGEKPGRTSDQDITLFKSLGLAIEDMACAEYLYEKAKTARVGTWLES